MASLLGGEYCIESLHHDVQDLQSIINEVQSRVGQVKYQSWKFPDKAASDLNVSKLLENCKYSEDDEEESQMSHIMLYDLVIDRMVYLLQSFICFNEILLNADSRIIGTSPASLNKKGGVRSMSIGLSVKKCWARITQIAATLQKLAKQVNERPSSLPSSLPILNGSDISEKECDKPESLLNKTLDTVPDKDVSCDVRTFGCQTAESAYSTCETCCKVQESLHIVGSAIVKICKEQSLPTSLEDYQSRYTDTSPMSVADLLRWGKHQSKDLSRISRHMGSLMKQVNPLKSDLANAIKAQKATASELQCSQAAFDRKANELREEFRRKEYVLNENEKDLKKRIATLETIKASMEEEIEKCKWKISDLKDELLQKHRDQLSLENSMNQLKEEAVEGKQYKKDAIKFKTELARVACQVEELEQSIGRDRQLYERERTKNDNLAQHEKMLQDKQKCLLRKMEFVNEECEKLREQVMFLEDERDAMNSKIDSTEKNKANHEKSFQDKQESIDHQLTEVGSLQELVKSLQKENGDLQDTVTTYCERERLIVAYPDLNQEQIKSPMIQGSGDVFVDMKSQIDANAIRIDVLRKENDALQKALKNAGSSMESNRSQGSYSHRSLNTARSDIPAWSDFGDNQGAGPVQLWKASDISTLLNDGKNDSYSTADEQHFQFTNHKERQSAIEATKAKAPSGRNSTFACAPNHPHKRSDVPHLNGTRVAGHLDQQSSATLQAYKESKNQWRDRSLISNGRNSFTVGAGRRSNGRSRPSSAKSALFKPWT